MERFVFVMAFLFMASPTSAGDLLVGIGVDDVSDRTGTEAITLGLEYHANPFYE